jgi:hypothetical protein
MTMAQLNADGDTSLNPDGDELLGEEGDPCCCMPDCPPAALLTLVGVDASTPCLNRLLGLGLGCGAPYYCVSGVSTAVDAVYYVPRSRGPTTDGWCEFRGEFDAAVTFTRSIPTSVFLGTPSGCHDPVDFTCNRIRIFARVNRGCVREVWVWALSDAWAGVGVPSLAVPISFFDGYSFNPCYSYVDQAASGSFTPTTSPAPFNGCAAATCGRLMSGGGFKIQRSL